ncbi:MAG: NAD(P)/FAD-dependent oxidoreductase [Neomegalonema sp.]|nr:NAD(P)/FAD-dependent oxidoreductase [Neomegalonema sp.]
MLTGGKLTRRRVLAAGTLGAAALFAPAIAQGRPRIVIVGGGPGGARVARRLSAAADKLDISLVSAEPAHTTGSLSNFYLIGLRSLRSLTFELAPIAESGAVRIVIDRVVNVDASARNLRLAGGDALDYDRLILAPGISFQQDAISGYDAVASEAMPHAYSGGYQIYLLKQRLAALPPGGVFAIAAPPDPARCAPAPYERASMAAALLSRVNPKAKIFIFDAKDDFPHRKAFTAYWAKNYGEMIAWRPASFIGGGVVGVDPREMTLRLGTGDIIRVAAASVSPPQQAASVAFLAGVVDGGGWAPVSPDNMRSTIVPEVYVIGDSARLEPMPKTAYAALAQADRCAAALLNEFGVPTPLAPLKEELWSFAGALTSYKTGAAYTVADGALSAVSTVPRAEPGDDRARLDQALEARRWHRQFVASTYLPPEKKTE